MPSLEFLKRARGLQDHAHSLRALSSLFLLTFLAVVVAWVGALAAQRASDAYGYDYQGFVTEPSTGPLPKLPDLEVEYDRESDLLSVGARQIPLNTLLQEIAKKAGLSVESRKDELSREQVSVEMKSLPLEQALTRLLREFNSALLYSTGTTTPRVVKVVVLSKKSPASLEARSPEEASATDPTPAEPTSGTGRHSAGSRGEELIRALVEKRPREATAIIDALGRASDEQRQAAIEALLETFKDRNFPAHDEVIAALRSVPADAAFQFLTKWLHGDDREASVSAAIVLGRLGHERAVDELRLALLGKDVETRHTAARSLVHIGGDKAVATLLEQLGHGDVDVRRAVVTAISQSDDPRATQALAFVVANETDVEARKVAAFHLVEREGPAAIPALKTALRDSDTRVRLFAAAFAGRLGRLGEPLLREALRDASPEVRTTAAAWLKNLRRER